MKNFFTLLCFFAFLSLTNAQIITSDWFLQEGDIINTNTAINPAEVTVPKGGVDVEWDFSNALLDQPAAIEYVNPSLMTKADSFPTATLAIGFPGILEVFFNNEGDTLDNRGFFLFAPGLGEIIQRFAPSQGEIIAVNPMMYGDVLDHTASIEIFSDGMLLGAGEGPIRVSFEGLGTAITPDRTTDNCVYIKTEFLDENGMASSTTHSIYRDQIRNPIAQYIEQTDTNTGEPDPSFSWQTGFSGTSTDDFAKLELTISNSLTARVQVLAQEQITSQIQLIDMNGKVLKVSTEELSPGSNLLDFSDVVTTNGQYVIFITDTDKGTFKTEKISILNR